MNSPMFEQQESPAEPGTKARLVRSSHLVAAHQVFADYNLAPRTLRQIARIASLRKLPKYETLQEARPSTDGVAVLVAQGTVREDFPHGRCRLWKRGALIGDWTGAETTSPTMLTALTWCKLMEISSAKIDRAGTEVFRALAQASMMRLSTAENVYGTDRRSPVARVAALLHYLGNSPDVVVERINHETTSIRFLRDGVVDGPAQVDIADALGISRASVEKALALLRDRGVLYKVRRGEARTNRRYLIKEDRLLASIAYGGLR
ncbi:hypothetical protein [Streptomyces tendae]|uniref:hypothetical protein n=1 Tax=Streptomyces tendae TaxID=1932 RepID=UPI003EBBC8F0